MTALPPFPGGYSSYATGVNNRGQVVGWAENGVPGPSCDPAFQVLQFRAAIWQPNGQMQELPPLPATAPVRPQQSMTTVRWSASPAIVALRYEAFVWTKAGGMKSLGKIPGDLRSTANGLNEKGDKIVGLSRGGPHLFRAILWENNKLIDMNSLTVPGSPFLLLAGDIDQRGHIVGEAFDPNTGESPGFIATPVPPGAAVSLRVRAFRQVDLHENVRRQIERRLGLASELIP
jgi:uncharacterized membrane protein